jgi:hypothetical protein
MQQWGCFTMASNVSDSMAVKNFFVWTCRLVLLLLLCVLFPSHGSFEQQEGVPSEEAVAKPDFILKKAVICERLKGSDPINETIVISSSKERAFCFTVFDPVFKETTISHNWYYKDKIISRFKRSLQPPRWETYSSHRLGNRVKGPWRVEITDDNGNILSVLRFSVTD